jgi:hypothetical protein
VEWLGGLIVVLGFIGLAKVFGLVERNLKVIQISRSAASVIGDNSLGDLQKEKKLQKYAKELLTLFLMITGISILALGVPLGAVWLMDALNLLSFAGVIQTITSTWFILATVGISLVYLFLKRGKKEESSQHKPIEQTLHNLAFETWFPRVPLSKLESQLYKNQLAGVSVEKPVFITALPRAGTTLALEICVGLKEFASHTYGDMPFLLTPLLWNRFSKTFRNAGTLTERVHGDGILVNVDSPESFEEIIWKEFWPSYYKEKKILPWSEARYPAFEEFFLNHIRKIILLKTDEEEQGRYVSKNNLNIARIGYLGSVFPDATILILFRSPLQHAASLLKQHRNFLGIHKEDRYAQKYMEDTGHFDFGENLRPVDFVGWISKAGETDPNTLSFWLQYWINTYQYLLNSGDDQVGFFSFESLFADPQSALERLGAIIEVQDFELLLKNVDRITSPKPHSVDTTEIPSNLHDQAMDLYRELQKAESL